MPIRINTNITSLNAQKHLGRAHRMQGKSLEKLASGSRINRSGDDAAGLAISENLKAEIKGLNQAQRNAEDGISLIQIAEGSIGEVSNILIRLRELAIQASSDTIGDDERGFLDVEYTQLVDELDRISSTTKFNGLQLLNGKGGTFDIQVGVGNDEKADRITLDATDADVTANGLGVDKTGLTTKEKARNSLSYLDNSINLVSKIRANFGALQKRLQTSINNINTSVENLSSANSRIRDTDLARESAELAKQNILVSAGTAVLAQANTLPKSALQLIQSAVG